jgi:hypothetical protein
MTVEFEVYMKKLWRLILVLGLTFGFGASAESLLGTKKPFYETVFCKFYLCDLIERKLLTPNTELFEYGVSHNESDYHSSIKSIWVARVNGVLTSGGMSQVMQDVFFAPGANAFIQRFVESLTDTRVSDEQLDQLQSLGEAAAAAANRTGNPTKEVSIPIGKPGQKMRLYFRLYPRSNYYDAQFRVSI